MTTYAQKLVKILLGSVGVAEITVMMTGQLDVTVFLTLLARLKIIANCLAIIAVSVAYFYVYNMSF